MIFLDPREGSGPLIGPLRKAGLTVDDQCELPAGDLYWVGRGEKGAEVNIGVEYKTVADLVSSIQTQRLQGHQLIAMRGAEEGGKPFYDYAYLLIHGELLYDKTGMLVRRSGRKSTKPLGITHDELLKRLNVLHLRGGLNWVRFDTQDECVRWISATYHTWTDTDLDQHKSHLGIYNPPTLTKPTQFEHTMRSLPGVGMQVARAASKKFANSIRTAINGHVLDWADLETEKDGKKRKFGMSNANKIMDAVK